jgi:hypothetical protein
LRLRPPHLLELQERHLGQLSLAVVQHVYTIHVDPIEAGPAVYLILKAVPRRYRVVARSGVYVVFRGAAVDVVVAESPVDLVLAVSTVDGVSPGVAIQGVTTGSSLYEVGALEAPYGVGVGRAD